MLKRVRHDEIGGLARLRPTSHVGIREGLRMMIRFWAALYPMLRWFALALLIYLFAQALPFDFMAVIVAGDMLTYLEIATAVWLAAQVTRLRWAAAYASSMVRRTIHRARVRARRAVRKIARLRPPSSDDDRPAPAFSFA
jgi:hypothetical protein